MVDLTCSFEVRNEKVMDNRRSRILRVAIGALGTVKLNTSS